MSNFRFFRARGAQLILCAFLVNSLWAAAPDGAALYQARCAVCHDGSSGERIPKHEQIAVLSPESIVSAMFEGAMKVQASGLTLEEGRAIARFVTGKEFPSLSEHPVGTCEGPAKELSLGPGDWNGWSVELNNSRYQAKPGLSIGDLPRLKVKWSFGFPGDSRAYAQPSVAGGRLFVGSSSGMVYSLDAATGCTYWSFKADGSVRAAISIARSKSGGRYIAYFGDLRATAYAVDASSGALIWKLKLDEHPAARITGSPVFYEGRLFVPMGSLEEASGMAPESRYECCTFRGSLIALNAETGRQLWKSFTVLDPPKRYKKSRNGTQMYGPAGAAIWSAPTIDAKRNLIYAATGDSYTAVENPTSDAILAFNMDDGSLVWSRQTTANDNFIGGCPASPNCPEVVGPNVDFGSSPMLLPIEGGKQIIVAGQKSGMVWGLDPDQKGKVLWNTKLGVGGLMGGVEWGPGADSDRGYVAISDLDVPAGQPGISALNLATGQRLWSTPAPKVTCARTECRSAQSAAVSVIPGAAFSGALNGHFRAYSTKTGEIVWDFDTQQSFDTVNKVPAKGGAINGGGPAIANGMVFTNSGYGSFGQPEGNVLLAFSVDGK